MLQPKILPVRIFLLLAIIASVSAVLGLLSAMGEIGEINRPVIINQAPTGGKVVISTDKTEYEQGEIIKIVVNNGLAKSILYSRAEGQVWGIEYFEDGGWVDLYSKKGGDFQLTEKNIGDACYIALYERPFPEELTSQSNLTAEWNQKICPFGTEGFDKPKIVRYIESGKYRLVFSYGFEISGSDPFIISESKAVYSNEFTIKEKTAIDSDIQLIAEKVLVYNKITDFHFDKIITEKLQLDAPSMYILSQYFSDLQKYVDKDVLTVKFNGDAPRIEYYVIINSIDKKIIAVYGIDRNAAPGIFPIIISEKNTAIDPRCSQKVKITGICQGKLIDDIGYQFNSEAGKCIEKVIGGSGCIVEKPFNSLEECQKTCAASGNKLKFETVSRSSYSEISERKNYVIYNDKQYIDLFDKIYGGIDLRYNIPSVDFSKDMVVAVFQGEKNTGGYSIEINRIIEKEKVIEVSVLETFPGRACMVTQALTSPYHVVKLAKSDKEVKFNVTEMMNNCEAYSQ